MRETTLKIKIDDPTDYIAMIMQHEKEIAACSRGGCRKKSVEETKPVFDFARYTSSQSTGTRSTGRVQAQMMTLAQYVHHYTEVLHPPFRLPTALATSNFHAAVKAKIDCDKVFTWHLWEPSWYPMDKFFCISTVIHRAQQGP